MRYEPDGPYPKLDKNLPHVAFQVDDLEQELTGKKVIFGANSRGPRRRSHSSKTMGRG
jgi:hypothetical protein